MTIFRILLLSTCFGFLMQPVIGQATYYPSINLQITDIDSLEVEFSWATPPKMASCSIVYETFYDTTSHNIPNFQLDSASVPRANPAGPWEKFTIVFTDSLGDSWTDTIMLRSIYGGIVIIEDDVFAAPVLDIIDDNPVEYGPDDWIYFVPACIVARIDTVHSLTDRYLAKRGIFSYEDAAQQINHELFSQKMILFLQNYLELETPGVTTCDGIYADSLETSRFGGIVPAGESEFQVVPNPFSDRLLVKALSVASVPVEITIYDLYGKVVYSETHKMESLEDQLMVQTEQWKPGMYILAVTHDGIREVHKLLKR